MATVSNTIRSMSTKVPRPKNWRTSPFDSPRPLMAPPTPPPAPPPRRPQPAQATRTPTEYNQHRLALRKAFPDGWSPPRKLSRDAMDGLRMLHSHSPETFTTPVLAERFKISPEAVRRILKSKWVPDKERKMELRMRDQSSKVSKQRGRIQKEWDEGVDTGTLKVKRKPYDGPDQLEMT